MKWGRLEPYRVLAGSPARALIPLLLLVLLALSIPGHLAAQGSLMPPGYHTSWWTTADGLPGNFVTDLTQGLDGRLWVIAGGVLARFDGQDFEVVRVGEGSLRSPTMEFPIAMEWGAGDTLWVSTYDRRLMARTHGVWVPMFDTEHELSELVVRPGAPPAGRVDVGSEVYLWQGGRRLSATDVGRFEAGERPSIALDASGGLWAVEPDEPRATAYSGAAAGRELPIATRRFVESSTGEGPLGVRRVEGRIEIIDTDGRVRTALPDGAGRVPRLVTRDGRVVASTPYHVEIFARGNPAPHRIALGGAGPVLSVLEDQEGGLWFGTNSGGLLHLRWAPFEVYQPDLQDDGTGPVQVIGKGRDGSVVAVADGFVRIRPSGMEPVDLEGLPDIGGFHAALEDDRGTLWLSVTTSRDEHHVFARLPDGPLRRFGSLEPVVEIVEGQDGVLFWLTESEYCRLKSIGWDASRPFCTDLGEWGARDLLVARDGAIWIAGDRGVRLERGGQVRHFTPEEGYTLARARALYEDADGTIWIGTYFGGLGRLIGDSLHMIRREDGLAEDVVSTILEDARGWLWMGGNQGIHGVRKASVETFLAGDISRVSSLSFDQRDGLPNPEGSGRQGARTADGRLWFPTFGGAVALPPSQADALLVAHGSVTVDRILSGDSVLAVADTVRLPPGARDLEIELASVSLRAPGTEAIEYRMEGVTPRWTPVRDGRTLFLSGLPPGFRRLEVRAVVPATRQSHSTAALVLMVPGRFTETGWFHVLVFVIAATLILLAFRIRTGLLRRRARELADEVREQTHWLEVERDRTAAALERVAETGAQLRELLVAKSRVFAGLSHELRTPMSLIIAPLTELEREADGPLPPTARGHLGTLRNAVRRLERLMGQFLDLADTQSGTLRLEKREVDLVAFLAQCVESMRPLAKEKGVHLMLETPPGASIQAELDPDQMDKVVLNLLANALRHAPANGQIQVRLATMEEDDGVVFEVQDDGPGVPPQYVERIFDAFFQAPDATGGMGLGLALSRDVVVLHGGRIEVVSPPGQGATFRVTLPRLATRGGEPALTPAVARTVTSAADPKARVEAPAGPRERVLIVEDERELQSFLADRLQRTYEIRTASGGEEALEILRDWTPHLVISDVRMPGLDGFGLCRILKANRATRSLPVVLLTALSDRDHQIRGLASGADDYVVKPFDMEQLSLRVANLLKLRRGIEDRFQEDLPAWASILLRSGRERLDARSEEFLERLYQTLLEGIGNPDLDVDGIAGALFLSRSSLYRRVRTLLDCSPLDLLAEIRLEQAALLLRTTGEQIQTIASRVGFRNAEHFSRRFVAHFGLTPRTYRTHEARRSSSSAGQG